MKYLLTSLLLVLSFTLSAQVASVKTESYKADFEKKEDFSALFDYSGKTIPVQILSLGISEEVYAMYPELKDKRVGLGVTNIVIEFLEESNRFTFTEEKAEIKNRMVKQFQASKAGISENQLDGKGKIKLANYFVYIEVYDFSVSVDEEIRVKDGIKETMDENLSEIKFNQSTIGTTTKKALEIAAGKIVQRMIKKGIFPN